MTRDARINITCPSSPGRVHQADQGEETGNDQKLRRASPSSPLLEGEPDQTGSRALHRPRNLTFPLESSNRPLAGSSWSLGASSAVRRRHRHGGCADRGDAPECFNFLEWARRGIAARAVRHGEDQVPLGNRWPVPRNQTIGEEGSGARNRLWPTSWWRTRRASISR